MSRELFSLRGRGALVTGAARGLGEGMALALAEAGADVAVVDVEPLDEATAAIAERGVRCAGRRADLSALTPEAAAELVAWARAELGDVSVLVNNAGMIRRAPAEETAADDWHEVLALNLTAPFLLSQAFARPLLEEGRRGSIVNVVSDERLPRRHDMWRRTRRPSTGCSASPARWRTSGRAGASASTASPPDGWRRT